MNPYQVLGVDESASDEEIRAAYLKLVRKYHPDKYVDNPLGDLAQEKMKEINQAYDMLTQHKKSDGATGGTAGANAGSWNAAGGTTPEFARIRQMIAAGNLQGAEAALQAINNRTAEWFYLYGIICLRRGWYNEARDNLHRASVMEPGNGEYRNAYASVSNMGNNYARNAGGDGGSSICGICTTLWCADCCCEACGGDFISCC